jgi:16S rRNA (cytosine967-C5)-methyltransferase
MNREDFRPARELGLAVLDEFDVTLDDAAGILRRNIDRTPDRSLLTDLVFGVIRNRICIDSIILGVGGVAIERISRKLINVIRMGVYELVYSPDREVYAVVSETMKQMSGMGEKQRGFVNAILRKTCRMIEERNVTLAESPARKTVPVTMERGCRFGMELLPDPQAEPAAYLARTFSLPMWLAQRWVKSFGFQKAWQAGLGSSRRPSVYVRANVLRTSASELMKLFRADGVECEAVIDSDLAIQTKGGRAIEKLPGYGEGLFSVQDVTASEAVRMLAPRAGWKVLDLCAAPGGKTTQMAEAMGDEGRIYATDIDAVRLKSVTSGIERMGIGCVTVIPYADVQHAVAEAGGFDAVLLDVPCSNTGVMARRCEVRYRLTAKGMASLTRAQASILAVAAGMVRAGGRICYSTCSIDRSENEDVVGGFLRTSTQFGMVAEKLTMPSAARIDRDGGYVAILQKK